MSGIALATVPSLVLSILLLVMPFAQAQELRLARNERAAEQAIAALILQDIYARAGLGLKVQPMPAARASAAALEASVDGEVARVLSYATKWQTNLIRVEPSYYALTSTAFAKAGRALRISRREDLRPYQVGIVRGIAHAEAAVAGMPGVVVLNTYEQMYQMLDSGRIDIAIDTGANGDYMTQAMHLRDIRPAGTLATLDLFNILTPNHRALAPKIGATIKSLKDSGELQKLVRKHEDSFLKSGVAP